MQYTALLFDIQKNVAHITLNRPNSANAINMQMARELMHVVMQCVDDTSIRAVLLTGSGEIFCGGGDLKDFAAQGEHLPYHLKEITTYIHTAISGLVRMDPPVIAAVNGSAGGAGLAIACACDIILATESARFTMGYTRVGLTPDGSLTYILPHTVGLKRALELTLTNRVLSAKEALAWGLITRVVPDAELHSQAQDLAVQLAAGPTRAFGVSKRLLRCGLNETLETQMENESLAIASMGHTADATEGITASLGKRVATFLGQ